MYVRHSVRVIDDEVLFVSLLLNSTQNLNKPDLAHQNLLISASYILAH